MANPLKSFAGDFQAFLNRGNVLELAVAFLLGAAFGDVVKSAAADLISPLIGVLFGDLNFADYFVVLSQGTPAGPYDTLDAARTAGAVVLSWGHFLTSVISFLITAIVLFFIVRYVVGLQKRMKKKEEAAPPTTKDCPFCFSKVPLKATRCSSCTSQLTAA